jgi:cytochrome c oxidase cbb3-type subunit 3
MTRGWSWYVIALVVLNIGGCLVLLWRTSRRLAGDADPEKTGHVWDGDITEFNKPLPRWWINLFYITIVFSVGYLLWFGGFGSFSGYSGWSSQREHAADKAAGDAKLAAAFRPYDGKPILELARDPHALALGRSVFANNCVTCHGSTAQGAIGFPNLTDKIWHWGGAPEQILDTVLNGRQAVMPQWSTALVAMGGASAVDDVVTYVQSLSGRAPEIRAEGQSAHDAHEAREQSLAQGKKLFGAICVACHGPEGKGNQLLGAPDLTDEYWLYGGSREAIAESIGKGRNGVMPAHKALLDRKSVV